MTAETRVSVEQADRDAAADYGIKAGQFGELYRRAIEDGKWDETEIVQAFARHRLAQPAIDREAVARIIDPGAWVDPDRSDAAYDPASYRERALAKADAILALASSNRSEPAGVRDAGQLRKSLDHVLSALSPLNIAGHPICSLDTTLARSVTEAVQACAAYDAALTARPDGGETSIEANTHANCDRLPSNTILPRKSKSLSLNNGDIPSAIDELRERLAALDSSEKRDDPDWPIVVKRRHVDALLATTNVQDARHD